MKKRFTKLFTLCALAILGSNSVNAQQKNIAPTVRCASEVPDAQWDAWMQEKINEFNQQRIIQGNGWAAMPNYTIPVIFHIIHNQATITQENISAAQVASQITVLNNDYAGTNADVGSIPSTFQSVKAGNTGIQFCLAKVDPSGNVLAEDGIERINWNTRGWADPNAQTSSAALQTLFNNTIKPQTIWDPTKYLNIWVAKMNGSGLLGYASFPAGTGLAGLTGVETATTCGVVLNQAATGTMGTAAAPYNGGRTATHEVGHWLGLRHIWGDGTCATDYCNDTPPAETSNGSCQTHPYNTQAAGGCTGNTTGEMFMNYMDYTPDNCMYMFTLDQATRMQTAMANGTWRLPLGSSTKCNSPFPLDVALTNILSPANGMSTCVNTITPRVVINNTGTTTLTSATVTYNMDGGANQVYNWTGSLAAGATATLTLNNYTGLSSAAHTFSATVSAPNGGVDGFAGNNTQTSNFTVTTAPAGAALPFTEGFETATFAPTGWSYTPVDATNRWTRIAHTFGLTAGSTGCAKMDNFSTGTIDPTGQRDALQTPALSFAAANSTLQVQFDVAHRQYNTTYIDSLNVWISTDCGGTWTKIYNKGGATLATVTPASTAAFTPTANGNWRRETVSLSSYAGQSVVYLKFESVSGWGNNLYLDNINISYTPTAGPPVANFTAAATKCAGSAIAFTDASTNTPTAWTWSSNPSTGVTITSSNSQNPNITFATAGTYTVSLVASNANGTSPSYTQAVVVNASPSMTSATSANICSGTAVGLGLTSSVPSSYSWIAAANAQVGGESTTAQTGATINNTLTNTTASTQTVTYSVTPTATTGGCVGATQTVNVSVIPAPAMTNATTASVCSGTPLAIALTSNIPSTYSWIAANNTQVGGESTTAQSGATINNTLTNTSGAPRTVTYSATPTSTTGSCVGATQVISVTVNILPTVTSTSTPAGGTVCAGTSVTLTGGGANTYAWTGGVTNATPFTATATTTYTVTGTTTATGCSNTATRTITVNPLPVMTSGTTANICSGTAVGLALTSDIASNYSWIATANANVTGESTTAQTTATINNTLNNTTTSIQTVTYSVTPTSTAGSCAGAVQTVTVTVVPAPTMTSGTTASICSGTPLAIALTSNIPSTYSWIAANNANVTGESTTAQSGATINNTLGNSSGVPRNVTYSVTPTSTTGSCVGTTQVVTVTVNILPTVAATSTTVCQGSTATITASGAATYSWNTGATTAGLTINPVTATTTYTVTGTAATTCTNTATGTITMNALPNVAATSTTVCQGNSATITGSGANTYSWNTGATTAGLTINPVTATTTYTVTGTDANNCSNTATGTITMNTIPNVTVNSPSTCSGVATTLTAGGASSYSWNTGATGTSISVSPTSNASYTVTGTDANGCVNTAVSNVSVTAAPNVTVNSQTICAGQSATLTGSGATSFSWNTGASTAAITVSPTGTTSYTVTGSNGPGCENTAVATVTVNNLPIVNANANPASATICVGSSITLTGSGANTYAWTGGVTDATAFNPTNSATYTVTGTDANGCSNTSTIAVTVNNLPSINTTSSASSTVCSGSGVTLTATGGNTYTWNTGATTDIISVSPSTTTTYTATGVDANGCSNTSSITVNVFPVNTPTISQAGNTLTASGAVSYQWYLDGNILAGETNSTLTATQNGSYTVVAVDANGCSATSAAVVVNGIGIKEVSNTIATTIYPNPTTGAFAIEVSLDASNDYTVEISDVLGRVINSETIIGSKSFTKNYDFSNESNGVYFITIKGSDKSKTVKRVVLNK